MQEDTPTLLISFLVNPPCWTRGKECRPGLQWRKGTGRHPIYGSFSVVKKGIALMSHRAGVGLQASKAK